MAIPRRRRGGSARPFLLACALLLLTAARADAQVTISGHVVDDSTGELIAGVRVMVLRENGALLRTVMTDGRGHFSVTLPSAGRYRLSADRLGYQPATSPPFFVDAREQTLVEMRLVVDAVLLAPLEIVGRTAAERNATLAGFYGRMNRGLGHFISREEIANRNASHVADLLRAVPGVRVRPARRGGGLSVYMGRALPMEGGCPTQVFVDGLLMNRRIASVNRDPAGNPVSMDFNEDTDFSIDELVSPMIIEGIEVYRGISGVPAEFLNSDSRCGVVLIWTRRGV
jgi:hypothetical protein